MADLSPKLLSKAFHTMSPQEFHDLVDSFYIQRTVKVPRVPNLKLAPAVHSLDSQTRKCVKCGKKPRKPDSKCSQKMSTK